MTDILTQAIDALKEAAKAGETAPVMAYILDNYNDWKQFPILQWIIENVDSDAYITEIYAQLETVDRKIYHHPAGNRLLFESPLSAAQHLGRSAVTEAIYAAILCHHAPYIMGYTHAMALAAYTKDMSMVRAYMRVCGTDFIDDPELIHIILYKDNVELMKLCLELGTDPNLQLHDGRSLLDAAQSDEMRALLKAAKQ